ncbi:hypothetical protein POM88_049573 [Heracleum sosnowskyi]|uniref:Uncharacterized protein n=1 Tax=Heracleum sosnowskyi TaxID=360622 RepID=A0AAD8GVW0_9APIA|nr:hypothetical protein POM88_049573 [Heracleum sosnowskyi]
MGKTQTQSVEVDREILEAHDKVAEKTEIYVPYNILPLDPDSANQATMRYPEIQAAVYALRSTRGLPWPRDYKKKKDEDLLDWLQSMFGFQKDSVANQREHLILLLADLDERGLNEVMKKLFKNYKKWCKFLDRKSSLWLPTIQQEVQQMKLLYMAMLDVVLNWEARQSMSFHVKLRFILKVLSAAAWVIILPVTYAYTWENPPGLAQAFKNWFGNGSNSPTMFIVAVVIYLSPKMLAVMLFLFSIISRYLERSNYRIVMLMMWWSQVRSAILFISSRALIRAYF